MSSNSSRSSLPSKIQNKIYFSKKFFDEKSLPCEEKISVGVKHILSFLLVIRTLFIEYGIFSICDQVFRSSTSVSANISEGRGRTTYNSFMNFLNIARGSLFETITHLEIIAFLISEIKKKNKKSNPTFEKHMDEYFKMASTLIVEWGDLKNLFENDWNDLLNNFQEYHDDSPFPNVTKEVIMDDNYLEIEIKNDYLG